MEEAGIEEENPESTLETDTDGRPRETTNHRDKAGHNKNCNQEEQRLYRRGVGMLLYLVKFSRPDLSNFD